MIYQKVDTGISKILTLLRAIQYDTIYIYISNQYLDIFDISKHHYHRGTQMFSRSIINFKNLAEILNFE